MKIIYCIAGTCHSGGMERVLANKANWLVRNGYDVCIITTDQNNQSPFFPLDERITCYDLGISYEENNNKGFLNKLIHYPFKQYQHKKKLSKLLKELKADVVISMFCNEASFLPSIQDGSKKVLEIHFSRFKLLQYGRKGFWGLADKYRSANYEKTARKYDKFVVLTPEDSSYWKEVPQMTVIPNARTFTCDCPAVLDNKEVIAVGRYCYQKGYDRLIQAWSMVHRSAPDWKLRIVGDGELRLEMGKQIAALSLRDSIILGRATHQMKEVYQNASIMALSSHYEGLPMVLLEAQAAGLPIVSFACQCGPKDVVQNGVNGFLIPEGDVDGLAEKILLLIQDEESRKQMGKQAFLDSEKYDEEIVMKQWDELFHQLMYPSLSS